MERIIRFTKDVAVSSSITEIYKVPSNGTLKKIYAKFYGSKKLLQVQPILEPFGSEIYVDLIKYVGSDGYISGDFEEVDEKVEIQIKRGDKLVVYAKNTDATTIHSMNVNMVIEVEG